MATLNDTIRDTLAQAHVDGKSRDEAIIGLVQDGISLNKATKAYAEWAKEEGIAPTLTSHKDAALDDLTAEYPKGKGWDAQAVKDQVVILADRYDIAESTARDYTKAFSDQLGVTHPVLNPREAIFNWFAEQGDEADKEEFMAFATGELKRSQSNANEYWKGYELHLFLIS